MIQQTTILGKSITAWTEAFPLLADMMELQEVFWLNDAKIPAAQAIGQAELSMADILDAEARLRRFASYFQAAFPETRAAGGILESPLRPIDTMKQWLEQDSGTAIPGRLLLKCDSELPISGSIKARGGIYEVLKFAEETAVQAGMLKTSDDYAVLTQPQFRTLFSKYAIAVGSTGNLGLSIGIISAALGFQVTVHI